LGIPVFLSLNLNRLVEVASLTVMTYQF
jgi:hypothetical protein